MELLVGNKTVDIYTARIDAEGISGKKRVIDVLVTKDNADASRADTEDLEQSLKKAVDEKWNLHAVNVLENKVDSTTIL